MKILVKHARGLRTIDAYESEVCPRKGEFLDLDSQNGLFLVDDVIHVVKWNAQSHVVVKVIPS